MTLNREQTHTAAGLIRRLCSNVYVADYAPWYKRLFGWSEYVLLCKRKFTPVPSGGKDCTPDVQGVDHCAFAPDADEFGNVYISGMCSDCPLNFKPSDIRSMNRT